MTLMTNNTCICEKEKGTQMKDLENECEGSHKLRPRKYPYAEYPSI